METTYINPKVDRSKWGDGPWDGEPDKLSWTDPTTKMPCLIVRNSMGSLCGYVAVPPGHSCHGDGYDDVPVDVHGGLTFADSCHEDGPVEGSVCHVPEPGEPDNVWWFGFDCAHYGDVSPTMRACGFDLSVEETYKTVTYVRSECERLASQLSSLS